jgi:hypothetical protein
MPHATSHDTTEPTAPSYDRAAILLANGPFNPGFMRSMFRALPLDRAEPKGWQDRRMHAALLGLSALHPRDEIEVMLGVQAMSAYHAAASCFHLGMNKNRPNGDSTRHINAACSAARTFDSLLRALERRQAKPLAVPPGRPAERSWDDAPNPAAVIADLAERVRADEDAADLGGEPSAGVVWTAEEITETEARCEQDRIEAENAGLDIANTEGILPGGGMILPEDPTPQQAAYIGRRLGLMYKREYAESLRKGITTIPKIRPIRPGDLIP